MASWRPGSHGTTGPSYSGSTLHPNLRSEVPWGARSPRMRDPMVHTSGVPVVSAHQGRLRYERPRFRAPDDQRNT